MNTELLKKANEDFNERQISKANYIKDKANNTINYLESEIMKLKEQIKIEKKRIKEANNDIIYFSN